MTASAAAGKPPGTTLPASNAPIRVVIDTSVLLRYLIKPSAATRELIEGCWLEGQVQMVTAPELAAELEEVLARDSIRKLIRPEEGQVLLEAIGRHADRLAALGAVPAYTRDPKDDKFVACAIAGDAAYLITEDKDLLVLATLADISIVTPYDFLNGLATRGSAS